MMVTRRSFMQSVLALGAAPMIVRAESLMRMRPTHLIAYPASMIACDGSLTENQVQRGFVTEYTYEATGIRLATGSVRATRVWANDRELPRDAYEVSPNGVLTFIKPLDLTPYGNLIPQFSVA